MQSQPTALEGIHDIELPLPPKQDYIDLTSIGLIILLSLLALSLAYVFFRWYFSPRAKAKRQLKEMMRELKQHRVNSHQVGFNLSAILCRSLGLAGITQRSPLPDSLALYYDRWESFIRRLSTARFSAREMDSAELTSLLEDADFWLRRWP
jgi:hypothetical protein